jgi:hypothetical protein
MPRPVTKERRRANEYGGKPACVCQYYEPLT